jgi:hypothetical protein
VNQRVVDVVHAAIQVRLTFAIIQVLVGARQAPTDQRPEAAPQLARDQQVPISIGRSAFALRQPRLVRRLGRPVDGVPDAQCVDQRCARGRRKWARRLPVRGWSAIRVNPPCVERSSAVFRCRRSHWASSFDGRSFYACKCLSLFRYRYMANRSIAYIVR